MVFFFRSPTYIQAYDHYPVEEEERERERETEEDHT